MGFLLEKLAEYLGIEALVLEDIFSFLGMLFSLIAPVVIGAIIVWHYRVRRFLDHITYSANFFEESDDGTTTLRIRTLCTLPMGDLLPVNKLFRWQLYLAIQRCTKENMFIRMSAEDMDVLQPALISGLSSAVFADGIVGKIQGLPVHEDTLYMAIAFEKDGSVKSQKLRIILATKQQLIAATQLSPHQVTYERSHHAYRLVTLKLMAAQHELEKTLSNSAIRIVRTISSVLRT